MGRSAEAKKKRNKKYSKLANKKKYKKKIVEEKFKKTVRENKKGQRRRGRRNTPNYTNG